MFPAELIISAGFYQCGSFKCKLEFHTPTLYTKHNNANSRVDFLRSRQLCSTLTLGERPIHRRTPASHVCRDVKSGISTNLHFYERTYVPSRLVRSSPYKRVPVVIPLHGRPQPWPDMLCAKLRKRTAQINRRATSTHGRLSRAR